MQGKFEEVATTPMNAKWESMIARQYPLYQRENEIRSEFERDYTRIIHSNAYRRLKHKTQVFFSPKNDHICTRIEHVNYVESISCSIAKHLGLNVELARAIAVGHDLGHAPFGHKGEKILSQISQQALGVEFWHEKNGVNFIDHIELLQDEEEQKQNLNLTYAVRDGIISHCGEIDENSLKPRQENIDLNNYTRPNEYAPYTWEACVVKIADKISYVFRDIEDALRLHMLEEEKMNQLKEIFQAHGRDKISNTYIINEFSNDLCKNSDPEKGLTFSKENFELLNDIKKFNYENIYFNKRVEPSDRYFRLVIHEIFDLLGGAYQARNTREGIQKLSIFYPNLANEFLSWIENYWDLGQQENRKNKIIYFVSQDKKEYLRAVIDYISGMTDNYAITIYEEIISF